MRVLWICSGLLPVACEVLGRSGRNGCGWLQSMVSALVSIDPSVEYCILCQDARACDVRLGSVRHVSFGGTSRFTYRQVPQTLQREIQGWIQSFKPDVIHIQGTEYFYGRLPAETYCDVPVVVSLQGLISGYHPHVNGELAPAEVWWTKFNLRGLLKGQTIWRDQTLFRETRTKQEAAVLCQQKYFIGRTEWDEAWVRYYHPTATYFKVNENLREPFFSVRRERGGIRPHAIYCGGATSYPLKGAHWLIRAIAALRGEFPDIQLRVAAAEGLQSTRPLTSRLKDLAYHAYLRKLIRDLGVSEHIVALPSLSAERVADELRLAELFVLPSMCENSPNSLGEAMLVGTPSIATFVGGVPSILKDGVEGKLVPSGDPAALAGAIRRWFLHPEEAEAGVEAARQTALKRHDAKANAAATLAVYRELIRC